MSAFGGTGQNDAGIRTFTATEDMAQYLAVKLTVNAEEVALAGGSDIAIGVTGRSVKSGGPVPVILLNKQGTIPMVAVGVIAVNARVYLGSSGTGKIGTSNANTLIGDALKNSTADGNVIEVLPIG